MSTTPCMVCGDRSVPHTHKEWNGQWGLHRVDYSRCVNCRFVKSETHFAMSQKEWEQLNTTLHSLYQGTDDNTHDPRWIERMSAQRDVLSRLWHLDSIPKRKPWLDWGAGDGKLATMLAPSGVDLLSYDAFMHGPDFVDEGTLHPASFDLVISTSVLEHLRDIETLDAMEALVSEKGVFAIHTLIAESVPADPAWFYYQAPHVAFFTNRSMQILFRRWGYAGCIYHIPSRLWFLFKDHAVDVGAIALELNRDAPEQVAFAAHEFVGYWTDERLGRSQVGHAA